MSVRANEYPKLRLNHLVSKTSSDNARGNERSTRQFDSARPSFSPRAQAMYSDSSYNQLANDLTQVSNEPLGDFFNRWIARPIGMRRDEWGWGSLDKIDGLTVNGGAGNAGKGIRISARTLARLGHLYVNRGRWRGAQLLSEEWIRDATGIRAPGSLPRDDQRRDVWLDTGYGYGWVPNRVTGSGERIWPKAPDDTYMSSGLNHNRMYIVPSWNLIFVRLGENGEPPSNGEVSTFFGKLRSAAKKFGHASVRLS